MAGQLCVNINTLARADIDGLFDLYPGEGDAARKRSLCSALRARPDLITIYE